MHFSEQEKMKILIVFAVLAKIVLSDESFDTFDEKEEIQLGTVIGIDLGTTYSW